ncbi:MAG: PIN domain-containing protein [Chloroflexota bacterium]
MKRLFVDTSAWDAIEDGGDKNHAAAMHFKAHVSDDYILVTTDYILDETYTLLLLNIGHQRTLAFHEKIVELEKGGILQIVHISELLREDAWKIFERFDTDKFWSFTDCTSLAVIQELNIEEVFAFDHHFDQMGLSRLP